jgi:hypothetical protein
MPGVKPKLPFHNLSKRHYGLALAVAASYTEAARVCLDRHHVPPVDFAISYYGNTQDAIVKWDPTDNRTKAAWANETDTTEAGAYVGGLAAPDSAWRIFLDAIWQALPAESSEEKSEGACLPLRRQYPGGR